MARKTKASKSKKTEATQPQEQQKPNPQADTTTTAKKTAKSTTTPGSRREVVIALVSRIAQLRAELQRSEAELDGVIGTASPRTKATTTAKGREGSVAARVIAAMGTDKQTFTAASLAQLLESDPGPIRSALLRLSKSGRVRREERGTYSAVVAP